MNSTPASAAKPLKSRLFYSLASLLLLVLAFVGFKLFYLEGKAYPGHPLPPPTRALLITHGLLMSAWILLAVIQPWLIVGKKRKLHMMLGRIGAVLAAVILVAGIKTGIDATRITPPDLVRFTLAPKAFLIVPLSAIILFAVFVLIGVLNRSRPEIHKPMMLLASLSAVSAALGRITVFNIWLDGTVLEQWLTAFVTTVLLGLFFWVVKCLVERRVDRWMGIGVGAMAVLFCACSHFARTGVWDRIAGFLLG